VQSGPSYLSSSSRSLLCSRVRTACTAHSDQGVRPARVIRNARPTTDYSTLDAIIMIRPDCPRCYRQRTHGKRVVLKQYSMIAQAREDMRCYPIGQSASIAQAISNRASEASLALRVPGSRAHQRWSIVVPSSFAFQAYRPGHQVESNLSPAGKRV